MRRPGRVRPLAELGPRLLEVEKPARYLGGELGTDREAGEGKLLVGISFPDLYEIGMSNNAIRILYEGLNRAEGVRCERVFAPAPDFEALLAATGLPLYTLEGGIPLRDLDLLGFTLGYELAATSLLSVLKSGGVTIRAEGRGADEPIVLAGGPAISNPHVLADFLDAAYIGEAESSFFALAAELAAMKRSGAGRADLLERLALDRAVWLPARPGRPARRAMRAVYEGFASTTYDVARPLPTVKTVQEHGTVEIMRGCPNGCRFCHAGYYYRPQRSKSPETIRREVELLVRRGGHREITLASLSSGDYRGIGGLLRDLNAEWRGKGLSFQLPSLKISSFTLPILEELAETRKGGLTFAVETPVDAWQRILNKDVCFEKTLAILSEAKARGYRLAKFYFMIGLPVPGRGAGEVEAILEFFERLNARLPMSFNVNVGTFVPKPHTPFQWCSQLGEDESLAAINALRAGMRRFRNVKLSWHSPFVSALEGVLARGDERVGRIIEAAFDRGARLDAWEDRFDRELWRGVIGEAGWDVFGETLAERPRDAALPWDDISVRVSKAYLSRELDRAFQGDFTSACMDNCTDACGSCSDPAGIVQNPIQEEVAKVEITPLSQVPAFRLVLGIEKRGVAAWFQHLSIVDALTRAFSMLDLPACQSEGFNPQPRFEMVQPLPIGVESRGEVAVLLLRNFPEGFGEDPEAACDDLKRELDARLPEGLRVAEAALYPVLQGRKQRSVGSLSWGSDFSLALPEGSGLDPRAFEAALRAAIADSGAADSRLEAGESPASWVLRLRDPVAKGTGILALLRAVTGVEWPQGLVTLERRACLAAAEAGNAPESFFGLFSKGA